MAYKKYTNEAVELLSRLISTPSVSRDEKAAADILQQQIKTWGLPCKRIGNNLMVAKRLSKKKPTLLLNAHIDTVKPVATWTRDPFTPTIEDGKLYGLGLVTTAVADWSVCCRHTASCLRRKIFRIISFMSPPVRRR